MAKAKTMVKGCPRKMTRMLLVELMGTPHRVEFAGRVQPWQVAKVWDVLILARHSIERIERVRRCVEQWLKMSVKIEPAVTPGSDSF